MNKVGYTSFASERPTPGATEDRQWVQLLPSEAVVPDDNRDPWRVEDARAVVAASAASAALIAKGIPVDFNHAMEHKSRTRHAPAAGWIEKLEARFDGIWGQIAWTSEGRDKIAGRVYRYISPVFAHSPDGKVQAILRAGLTNTPALTMEAICSADADDEPEMIEGGPETATEDSLRTFLKEVYKALSMPVETPFEEVLNAIETAGSGQAVVAQSSSLEGFADMLFARSVADQEANRDRLVTDAMQSGRLPPALKDWGAALCTSDPKAFETFIASSPIGYLNAEILTGAAVPTFHGQREDDGTADAICALLGLSKGALT